MSGQTGMRPADSTAQKPHRLAGKGMREVAPELAGSSYRAVATMKSWFGRTAGQDGSEREQRAGRAFVGGPPTPHRVAAAHGASTVTDSRLVTAVAARRAAVGRATASTTRAPAPSPTAPGTASTSASGATTVADWGELRTSRASSAAGNRRFGSGSGAGGRCVGARGGQHVDMVSSAQERRCCAVGKSDGARDETAAAPGSKQGRPEQADVGERFATPHGTCKQPTDGPVGSAEKAGWCERRWHGDQKEIGCAKGRASRQVAGEGQHAPTGW